MIFLIHYDRSRGQLVNVERFNEAERYEAENFRIELELKLACGQIEQEVVLLEADSEDSIRRTHRRYFEDLEQLATAP